MLKSKFFKKVALVSPWGFCGCLKDLYFVDTIGIGMIQTKTYFISCNIHDFKYKPNYNNWGRPNMDIMTHLLYAHKYALIAYFIVDWKTIR